MKTLKKEEIQPLYPAMAVDLTGEWMGRMPG